MIAAVFEGGELIVWDALLRVIVEERADEKVVFAKYNWSNAVDTLIIVKETGVIELEEEGVKIHFSKVNAGVSFAEISVRHLYTIDALSVLSVVSLKDGAVIGSFNESDMGIGDSSGITSLGCHGQRDLLTIVFKNRTIRVAEFNGDSGKLVMKFKLSDSVNKWPWRLSGFSQHEELDSVLIFGSALSKGKHLIYLWDNVSGSLVQTLEGPKEEVSLALWHPAKPQLISVGALTGQIYVWGPEFPQKWAALVPNIEAIETNIEYIEKEDEFDLPIEEEILQNREIDESVAIEFKDFINCHRCQDRDDDRSLYYPIDLY